jgi:hypothetical protein
MEPVKANLLSRFRSLFRRAEPEYEYDETYVDDAGVVTEEPGPEAAVAEEAAVEGDVRSGRVLKLSPGAQAPAAEPQGRGLHVPLAPIIAGMPLELQSRVQHEVGDLSVFLSLEAILPQLARGVVSITFGELRSAAPRVFTPNRDQDAVEVDVPLSAVLPHISPDMLSRRHGPLQMDIPDDIVSPFANKGQGLAIGMVAPVAPQAPSAPRPSSASPNRWPAAAPSHPSLRPTAAPPVRPAVARPTFSPSAPPSVPAPAVARPALPRPTQPAVRVAASNPVPASPGVKPQGTQILARTRAAQPAPTQPIGAPPSALARPEPGLAPLTVALSAVATAWSDSLKQEILQLNLADASLTLPFDVVEAGLKRGRLSFPWSKLKSWIHPSLESRASVHDVVELELPLRVIAPLFIAQKKEQPQKAVKVAVDRDIPNLFFGLPQPDTTGMAVEHAVNKPVDTNYYVWSEEADVVPDDPRNDAMGGRARRAGTEFVTRYATPNEVISRAAALDGVEGAVIALPDGLMVASQLPPGLNGDTLAALIPQLFGKVSQCTQELRMGEVNNLNFTVGNIPWKIFRINALYFAAFGRKGQALPTAQLAALVGELDHKAKV